MRRALLLFEVFVLPAMSIVPGRIFRCLRLPPIRCIGYSSVLRFEMRGRGGFLFGRVRGRLPPSLPPIEGYRELLAPLPFALHFPNSALADGGQRDTGAFRAFVDLGVDEKAAILGPVGHFEVSKSSFIWGCYGILFCLREVAAWRWSGLVFESVSGRNRRLFRLLPSLSGLL